MKNFTDKRSALLQAALELFTPNSFAGSPTAQVLNWSNNINFLHLRSVPTSLLKAKSTSKNFCGQRRLIFKEETL